MLIAPLGPRDRLNLARDAARKFQLWTYAAGAACLVTAIFADPQHRLAFAAFQLFAALLHLIIR